MEGAHSEMPSPPITAKGRARELTPKEVKNYGKQLEKKAERMEKQAVAGARESNPLRDAGVGAVGFYKMSDVEKHAKAQKLREEAKAIAEENKVREERLSAPTQMIKRPESKPKSGFLEKLKNFF